MRSGRDMYPEKGLKTNMAGTGDNGPAIEGFILDDDWAEHWQSGRGRFPEDSDLDMGDDALLML